MTCWHDVDIGNVSMVSSNFPKCMFAGHTDYLHDRAFSSDAGLSFIFSETVQALGATD